MSLYLIDISGHFFHEYVHSLRHYSNLSIHSRSPTAELHTVLRKASLHTFEQLYQDP